MLRLPLILLLLTITAIQGCAYGAYGLYDDKRLMDTITDDKGLATSIKTALLDENFSEGLSISVYCYYQNVFLVGQIPQNLQAKAVGIARRYHPATVTPHWFKPGKSDRSNFGLASSLRAELIGTSGLSSTRIDTEVNAGRVVLLGVVNDAHEKKLAVDAARRVKGVQSVTSYLMLPPTSNKTTATPEGRTAPAPKAAPQQASKPAPAPATK